MKEVVVTPEALAAARSELGRLGGKAGRGISKRRPPEYYKMISKLGVAARREKRLVREDLGYGGDY
jgi:hypothetical protein